MSVLLGDCLKLFKQIESNSIDLIYLDPPFFSQKVHSLKSRDNEAEFHFRDTWDSLEEYLNYLKARLYECRRVLKETGSVYLHCDKSASHYLKVIMDEVFGVDNFQNEIIWAYKRWTNSKNCLQNAHQNIFFYSKTQAYKFHTIYSDYSASTNIDQILQERKKNEHGKSAYKTNSNGEVVYGKSKKGVPLGDVWNIPFLNPKAKERIGYPTQKPILLLERIIEISSDPGDIVLDPFCGSGTTLVAAHLLGRKFIGIDISEDAIEMTTERLANPVKTTSRLLDKGEEEYINKTTIEKNILLGLNAVPVQRNSGIDGFLQREYLGKVVPIKIQRQDETLEEARQKLLKAARKRQCDFMVLVKTKEDGVGQTTFNLYHLENANIFVLKSYELSLDSWLNGLSHIYQMPITE